MNYIKHYIKLIRRAQQRYCVHDYCEKHHIFPQSIFGINRAIVSLAAREHYIAHLLLWKACKKRYGTHHYRTKKMHFALNMMTWTTGGRVAQSRSFALARSAAATYNRGDNNPSKRDDIKQKISKSKIGHKRPDMRGKRYFGADVVVVNRIVGENAKKRLGQKTNYPKNRNSPPCSIEKKARISAARQRTKEKFRAMSEVEFELWLKTHSGPTKSGRKNTNVTRAIIWRNSTT